MRTHGSRRTLSALVALAAVTLPATLAAAACGDGGSDSAPTTSAVTLTTEAGLDPVQLGGELLAAAGVTNSVMTGSGAEQRLVELSRNWCTTALRSDVANADSTFRFSLNEFVTDYGIVSADGEVQDVPLARSVLASELAAPLTAAANELLCPEVDRPT